MKELTQEELNDYIQLKDEGYFRMRLIHVLEKLAVAHGCECSCGCTNDVLAD